MFLLSMMARVRKICKGSGRNSQVILALGALALGLWGCPLPFQFSPSGWPSAAPTADPSTPEITAPPVLVFSQSSGGGGTLGDGQSGSTSSDTRIQLECQTVGAVIYYTTDGSAPDPRAAATRIYRPDSPITLAIASPTADNSSKALLVKAAAIGPNMKPSLVASSTVSLQYPQTAQPTFSPPGGGYTEDQSVQISSATPGAVIYYTLVGGAGPAPRPQPGQAGTLEYTGAVAVPGPSNTWTLAAIAVKDQMIDSTAGGAQYTVSYPLLPAPALNPPPATYANDQAVVISSDSGSTIWYTTDGSAPVAGTSPSFASGGSVPLAGGAAGTGQVMLRAVATRNGSLGSSETAGTYTFRAAPVSFSPAGFTATTGTITVTLANATAGAGIQYSTDLGSSYLSYPGPILLPANGTSTTIWAKATRQGYQVSTITSQTYVIAHTPQAPRAGAATSTAISVAWDAVPGAVSYQLMRDTTPGFGSPAMAYSGTSTAVTDGGLSPSTAYYYAVKAVYAAPVPASALSPAVQGVTLDAAGMPSVVPITLAGQFSYVPAGQNSWFYLDDLPSGNTTTGPSLREGGYTFVPYGTSGASWPGTLTLVCYDANNAFVNEWVLSGTRYVWKMTVDSGTGMVIVWGQKDVDGSPLFATIPWSTIRQ
jgi:hypothetical protein